MFCILNLTIDNSVASIYRELVTNGKVVTNLISGKLYSSFH